VLAGCWPDPGADRFVLSQHRLEIGADALRVTPQSPPGPHPDPPGDRSGSPFQIILQAIAIASGLSHGSDPSCGTITDRVALVGKRGVRPCPLACAVARPLSRLCRRITHRVLRPAGRPRPPRRRSLVLVPGLECLSTPSPRIRHQRRCVGPAERLGCAVEAPSRQHRIPEGRSQGNPPGLRAPQRRARRSQGPARPRRREHQLAGRPPASKRIVTGRPGSWPLA